MAEEKGREPFATGDGDRRAKGRDTRWRPQGGGEALLLALLAGTAPMALLAPRHATAQVMIFTQSQIGDQVYDVQQSMERCDKENLRKGIDGLKRTKTVLESAAKSGVVQGAGTDADNLGKWIQKFEKALDSCKDTYKVTGLPQDKGKITYGFGETQDRDTASKILDDAQNAAKKCNLQDYKDAVEAARKEWRRLKGLDETNKTKNPATDTFLDLWLDLSRALNEVSKRCERPKKTVEAPKEPGTVVPGTGTTTEPGKPTETPGTPPKQAETPKSTTPPPEAPKTPPSKDKAMLPGGGFKFGLYAGAQFDGWQPVNIGSLQTGGPFLPSHGSATGFNIGAFGKLDIPTASPISGQSLFGVPGETMLKFNYAWASTRTSVSGSGANVEFVFLRPFNGTTNSFLGLTDGSVKSTKDAHTFEAYWNQRQPFDLWNCPGWDFGYGAGLRYQRVYVGHDARLTSFSFPGEQHALSLDTFDNYLGPAFQFGLHYYRGPWSFGAQYTGVLSARFTNATARQESIIPGFPGSPFSTEVKKSTSGFAYQSAFDLHAGYSITPSITVGAYGGLLYNTAQSHWQTPLSPGESTRLRTSGQLSGNLGAYLRFGF